MLEHPYNKLDIPDALQAGLQRHLAHLSELVCSLRSVGLSEEQIELSVSTMVESYRSELMRAMKALAR